MLKNGTVWAVGGIFRDITERKRMEDALRASEENFKQIFETMQDAVLHTDLNGQIRMANPVLAKILGYESLAELLKLNMQRDIWAHPEERDVMLELVKVTGAVSAYRLTWRRKNGELRVIESDIRLIKDENGQPVGLQGIAHDMTDRVTMEEALRAEKELVQKYLDVAGVILVVINPDQTVKRINHKGCAILGYEEHEIVGKNWFEHFLPPADRRDTQYFFEQIVTSKIDRMEYYENLVRTKSGTEHLISWHNTILYDPKGQIQAVVSSGEDVTERNAARQRLAEVLELNQKIIAASSLGIIVYKATGECVLANEAAASMIGGTAAQLLQTNFRHLPAWQQTGLLQCAETVLATHWDAHLDGTTECPDLRRRRTLDRAGGDRA